MTGVRCDWSRRDFKLNCLNLIFFLKKKNKIETLHFACTVQAVRVFVTVPTANSY